MALPTLTSNISESVDTIPLPYANDTALIPVSLISVADTDTDAYAQSTRPTWPEEKPTRRCTS